MRYKQLYRIECFDASKRQELEDGDAYFVEVPEENCILVYDALDTKECNESDAGMDEDFENEVVEQTENSLTVWISSYYFLDNEEKAIITQYFESKTKREG